MKSYLATALLSLAILPTASFAQTAQGLFCTAGIQGDGFIDFSLLPPAPAPVAGQPTPAVTVTIPVTGIAGLTVQIMIPAPTGNAQSQAAYFVSQGTLVLPGSGATVGLVFSKPVFGVSAIDSDMGRSASFSISAVPPSANSGESPFTNSVQLVNLPEFSYTQPLQMVNISTSIAGFTNTYLTADAGNYGSPAFANVRVQSTVAAATSLVPKTGLQLWLSSDTITPPLQYGPVTWTDSSGNHRDATQTVLANVPGSTQAAGNNCRPAYGFSGTQFLNFNLPIDGWQQMTIFLVASPSIQPPANSGPSNSAAILWVENAYWGNTFVSPYPTAENFRFGTEQVGNAPIYTRPTTIGQDFTITRAVHNNATDSLYVNSLLALSQGGKSPVLAGTSGAGLIGQGYNNTGYNGLISEILVYNRVLTSDEAASVESYLRNKFGTR